MGRERERGLNKKPARKSVVSSPHTKMFFKLNYPLKPSDACPENISPRNYHHTAHSQHSAEQNSAYTALARDAKAGKHARVLVCHTHNA